MAGGGRRLIVSKKKETVDSARRVRSKLEKGRPTVV